MADVQSWLVNDNYNAASLIFSDLSPSLSSSSTTTRSAPSLCEDSSFSSIRSSSSARTYYRKPSVSHFCISSTKATAAHISCLAVHGGLLNAATIKGINVFDPATLALVDTFGSGSGWAKSIAFTNGKIFTAHQDCKIRVWTPPSISPKSKHHLVSTLPTLKDRFHNCLSAKNYVKVRRNKRRLWIQHADADRGELYSISWDKSFKTWKTSSDIQCVDSMNSAHSDAVNAVAVSGGTVYTGSTDGQIKVWRATSDGRKRRLCATLAKRERDRTDAGREGVGLRRRRRGDSGVGELKGHKGAVLSLVCVGDFVISGSSDGRVNLEIWEGIWLQRLLCGGDGRPFGSFDGEIRVWKVVISDHYSD
ncbi:protein JINGUBANG-like [Salvia divinorum]|uniref:Protein JINGUBANG-like n=1 Tax=Salvia divinorum TaxID=28513 RepID=A0ABD1IL87_SALDI